ncbi:MAG TPA: ion transporter, partial [Cyclobacteriaceae bacterium]|nr:ion transporter [Cyclobacteriaceae bacterium]
MRRLKRILLNDAFILALIVINAVVIFIQGFDLPQKVNNAFEHIDNLITLIFLVELIVKLKAFGLRNYLKSNWNKFDFVLIILAIPSLYFWAFNGNSTQLEYLLVLRISRVFKFFRFLRFFPDIDHLIVGVQRALRASVIVLAGFMVYNFVISVLSCFMFRNIAHEYFA